MSPHTPLRRPGTPRTPANIISILLNIIFVCWVLVFRIAKSYIYQFILRGSGVWGVPSRLWGAGESEPPLAVLGTFVAAKVPH